MNKYKVLSLCALLSVAGTAPLLAATESKGQPKNLQAMSAAPEAAPNNSAQTDPENDSLATEASKDFSSGAKGLGRGFVKGAKVTGHTFQKVGSTMGRGFKRAGLAIRDYFAGKPEVEERDLNDDTQAEPAAPRDSSSEDLDAVGNDLPKRAEPKRLSKESSEPSSQLN